VTLHQLSLNSNLFLLFLRKPSQHDNLDLPVQPRTGNCIASPVTRKYASETLLGLSPSPFQEVARMRSDKEFTTRANRLLKRDKELLDRLAR
jgi:hypothetical protein